MSTAMTIVPDLQTPVRAPAQLTPESVAVVVAQAEAMRRMALDLRNEKVRTLGKGECFVRKTEDGKQLQAVALSVPLTLAQGHFCDIQGKYRVTAEGYDYLNRFAGIQVLTPTTVNVGGVDRPNPYIERSTAPGCESILLAVHCRAVAFGRSATGNQVMHEARLSWSPGAYLGAALISSAGKAPEHIVTVTKSEFEAEKKEGKRPGWIFLPIEVIGDEVVGVAAYVRNPIVVAQLKAHSERQKFGERIAVTICRRNALKKILGVQSLAPSQQGGDLVTTIPLISWVEPDSMLIKPDEGRANVNEYIRQLSEKGVETIITDASEDDLDEDPSLFDPERDSSPVEPVTRGGFTEEPAEEANDNGALWGEEG